MDRQRALNCCFRAVPDVPVDHGSSAAAVWLPLQDSRLLHCLQRSIRFTTYPPSFVPRPTTKWGKSQADSHCSPLFWLGAAISFLPPYRAEYSNNEGLAFLPAAVPQVQEEKRLLTNLERVGNSDCKNRQLKKQDGEVSSTPNNKHHPLKEITWL